MKSSVLLLQVALTVLFFSAKTNGQVDTNCAEANSQCWLGFAFQLASAKSFSTNNCKNCFCYGLGQARCEPQNVGNTCPAANLQCNVRWALQVLSVSDIFSAGNTPNCQNCICTGILNNAYCMGNARDELGFQQQIYLDCTVANLLCTAAFLPQLVHITSAFNAGGCSKCICIGLMKAMCGAKDGVPVVTQTTTAPTKAPCTPQSKADITFLIDDSGSIGASNYNNSLLSAVVGITNAMLPGDGSAASNSRVACVLFDDVARLQFDFTKYTKKNDILAALSALPYYAATTNTGAGFNMIRTRLQPQVRVGVTHLVIVITDGMENPDSPMKGSIESAALKAAGAKIFAIGVGKGVDTTALDGYASTPTANYRADVDNYADLASQMQKLATIACSNV